MSIFDQNKDEKAQPDSYKELMVGEGKKYSNEEELAKAYYNADTHIQKLQEENDRMRKQLESAENITKAAEQRKVDEVPATPEQPAPQAHNLSEEEFANRVDARIAEQAAAKLAAQNLTSIKESLIHKFGSGEKADQAFIEKANELGMDVKEFLSLGAKSPALVLNNFGVSQTQSPVNPGFNSTSQNIEGNPQFNGGDVKGKSYYTNMMLNDPKNYYSVQTQNEMSEARMRLGSSYNDY